MICLDIILVIYRAINLQNSGMLWNFKNKIHEIKSKAVLITKNFLERLNSKYSRIPYKYLNFLIIFNFEKPIKIV